MEIVIEELLAPKEEPQENLEQRVEVATQAEPSREGRKRTREVERLMHYVMENMGDPSNLCKKRRSLDWHTGYMALMIELVETKPSSFEE